MGGAGPVSLPPVCCGTSGGGVGFPGLTAKAGERDTETPPPLRPLPVENGSPGCVALHSTTALLSHPFLYVEHAFTPLYRLGETEAWRGNQVLLWPEHSSPLAATEPGRPCHSSRRMRIEGFLSPSCFPPASEGWGAGGHRHPRYGTGPLPIIVRGPAVLPCTSWLLSPTPCGGLSCPQVWTHRLTRLPLPAPRRLAKSTLLLIPLFGLHYTVFAFFPEEHFEAKVKLVFELAVGSFQVRIVDRRLHSSLGWKWGGDPPPSAGFQAFCRHNY